MKNRRLDEEIVRLFWERDERALTLTEKKHGPLIFSICRRILLSDEDAFECSNSILFEAWSKIPPEKPESLAAFLSRIARNTAIDRLREKTREKRQPDRAVLPYEELADLIEDHDGTETAIERKELSGILDRFLTDLPINDRRVFLMRYYNEQTLEEIAAITGLTKQGVLYKLRKMKDKLKTVLEKEGYFT